MHGLDVSITDEGRRYGSGLEPVLGHHDRFRKGTFLRRAAAKPPRSDVRRAVSAGVHGSVPVAVPRISEQIGCGGGTGGPRSLEGALAPGGHCLGGKFGVEYELVGLGVLREAALAPPADESVAVGEKLNTAEQDPVLVFRMAVSFDHLSGHCVKVE